MIGNIDIVHDENGMEEHDATGGKKTLVMHLIDSHHVNEDEHKEGFSSGPGKENKGSLGLCQCLCRKPRVGI